MRARCTFPLVAVFAALGVAMGEAAPAADLEVEQLRRDIRELERTVAAQARRIDQLERSVSRSSVTIGDAAASAASAEAEESATPAWLAAERWQG
ncbi:MAG TPA: hypothetical protein VLT59_05800, partial [Steroidobacteraceae bacterium]|nr:hypothetical protein [Steroidobacteraceae bacterium]